MILEYELQGSQLLHKGIFDTNGFWVKYDRDVDDLTQEPLCHKLWSHFSFTYETTSYSRVNDVYDGLISALGGIDWKMPGVGFIREVC